MPARCPVCKTSTNSRHCAIQKAKVCNWRVCKCKYSEKMAVIFDPVNNRYFLRPGG